MAQDTNRLAAEIAADLRGFGLTDHEAQAYLALLQESPATAYQVSKESGLPRANVYAAVESLAKKGFAQPVTENPLRYVPVQPEALFARMLQDIDAQCRRAANKLSQLRRSTGEEYVWTLRGDEAVRAKIASMIAAAQSHVWIKAHARMLEGHRAALLGAAKRGVQIILILFGEPAALDGYRLKPPSRVYMHENSGLEVGLANNLITVATDFKEALTANTAEGGCGAYTRNLPVVNLAESLIRHEIYLAEIFGRFGPQIEAEFGPALVSLRRNYLPSPQASALVERLGRHGKSARAGRADAAERRKRLRKTARIRRGSTRTA